MRLTGSVAAMLGIALGACAPGDARTQLEAAARITPSEAGLYSFQQLSQIKQTHELDGLDEGEKRFRIERIKSGRMLTIRLGG